MDNKGAQQDQRVLTPNWFREEAQKHRAESVKHTEEEAYERKKDQLLTWTECVQPGPLLPVEGFVGTSSLSSLKRMGVRCRALQQSLQSLATAAENLGPKV